MISFVLPVMILHDWRFVLTRSKPVAAGASHVFCPVSELALARGWICLSSPPRWIAYPPGAFPAAHRVASRCLSSKRLSQKPRQRGRARARVTLSSRHISAAKGTIHQATHSTKRAENIDMHSWPMTNPQGNTKLSLPPASITFPSPTKPCGRTVAFASVLRR